MKAKHLTVALILGGLFVPVNFSFACPTAVLEANRQYIIVGKNVILDGSNSNDVDGPITKYEWDFTDNNSYDYTETSSSYPDGAFDGKTTYAYSDANTYTVRLRATDNTSNTDTDTYDVNVTADSDGDGLPVAWENLYVLSDANSADADEDRDSDGYNNLCEYLHDSNANDVNKIPDANYPITIYVPAEVNSIQRAIDASIVGDTVMVSKGIYYEAIDFGGASITVTSTDPNDPFVVAATIIDGNDDVYHVVTFKSNEDANSVFTGFTITDGNADGFDEPDDRGGGIDCNGASPTISNCVIADNGAFYYGGGMHCYNNASPTITNCFFWNNTVEAAGAGLCNINASPTIVNCVFSGNWAGAQGGGLYNEGSSPLVINCTLNGNYSDSVEGGGGMANYSNSDPNVVNCVIWGNTSANPSSNEVYSESGCDPNYRYCDVNGCGGSDQNDWDENLGKDGGGNIDQPPGFIDPNDPCGPDGVFGTANDGLRIWIYSACVDRADGNCATVPNVDAPDADITGQVRIDIPYRINFGTGDPNYVDIGAYEAVTVWFVNDDATGDDDGTSWQDARTHLQDALADANSADQDEIWVAQGPYEPNDANNRSACFQLVQNVGVYGGFAGTEFARYQRDWGSYTTVLSGDIGTPNDVNDNSYHVVKGADNAILDGFTVTGGNANGSGDNRYGGGVYCSYTSPTITNCTITGNNSSLYGGGMYAYETCTPIVKDCLFRNNSSTRGGGLANRSSSYDCLTKMTNCAFIENDATYGGGIYNVKSLPTVTNCTFTENDASFYGGGMFSYLDSDATVTNCIFWGDSPQEIYSHNSDPNFRYCDIEDCNGSGNDWDSTLGEDGTGNIDSDPDFADVNNPLGYDGKFGTYDDGLRLDPNSPCIDVADGDTAPLADVVGLVRVDCNIVDNNGLGTVDYADMGAYESYNNYGSDSDSDNLFDDEETLLDTGSADSDTDGDNLSDGNEFNIYHTDPNDDDTDNDGEEDGNEVDVYNTDPLDWDSDDDGLPDGWEIEYGLGPLDTNEPNGAPHDPDNDDANNITEYLNGTRPDVNDTDGDGMLDGWEIEKGTDPLSNDAGEDPDGDGLTNLQEYALGTNPLSAHSDGDGMDDGWEVKYGLNPLDDVNDPNGAQHDPDGDGRTNLQEYKDGSDPTAATEVSRIVYQYDNAGQITKERTLSAVKADVAVTQYKYDQVGRRWHERRWADVSSTDDVNDMITLYAFDVQGNMEKTIRKAVDNNSPDVNQAGDLETKNYYDSLGRLTRVKDANGDSTYYSYYDGGLLKEVDDPLSNKTTNYYDNAGRLEQVVDAEGHYRVNSYDSLGRTTKQIAYDDSNNPLMQTRYEYDGAGHITRRAVMADANSSIAIDPNFDMVIDYNYPNDLDGLLADQRVYYEGGTAVTSYEYDGLGRRTKTIDPAGNVTRLAYDKMGRVKRREQDDDNPLAGEPNLVITTEYKYDSLGRLFKQTESPNDANFTQVTTYIYDALGNRTRETRPNWIYTTYSYDALGRLTQTIADANTGGIGQTTEYGYDRLGRQTSITGYADPNTAQTTQYAYDDLDRITEVNYPDGNSIDFEYNAAAKVTRRNDQRGIVTTYSYDGTYSMTQKLVEGNGVTDDANETYTYDGLGRMLTAKKDVNSVTISESAYVYNDTGKVIEANEALFGDATPAEIRYTYDQAGYPNSTTYPHPASPVAINITPDHAGRIGTLKLGAIQMVTYDYVGSRVARRSYTLASPDIEYKPDYDGLGRITSADSGTGYAKFDYQYDANSNNIGKMTYDHRTGDPCTGDPCTDFTYDRLDRLTIAEYGIQDNNEVFSIDDLGNRDNVNIRDGNDVNYVVDNLTNRYESVDGNSLAYDAAGNLITDKDDYDYAYDYENRIIEITKDGNDIAEFAYDALGRRVRKIDSIAGTTRLYFYDDKWQVLTETDASETMQAWYAYGNYIDEVLLTAPIKVPMLTRCYVHDHLYSPAALTTASGTVQERYEYDAYGSPYVLEPNFAAGPDGASDYSNPYYFQGKRLDILDGNNLELMSWPYRDYSTYLGRWYQHDKLGLIPNDGKGINPFAPQQEYREGLNLYQGFGSRPVMYTDIYGFEEWILPPVEDPGSPPPPTQHSPPCLQRGGTTFGGCWKCCPNALAAIRIANRVLDLGGACTDWFTIHGSLGESYKVNIKRYMAPFPGGTWPFTREIYLAQWACKESPHYLATILVHETAHHYCPALVFGGESCANDAVEACRSGLTGN